MNLTGKFDETGKLSLNQSVAYIRGSAVRKGYAGKEVEVKIGPKRRTQRSNRYYFAAMVNPIADALSEFHGEIVKPETAHDLLKTRFGKDETIVDPETGEELVKGKTTKTMNKDEFAVYLMECERFGSEFLGIDWSELDKQRLLEEFVVLIS